MCSLSRLTSVSIGIVNSELTALTKSRLITFDLGILHFKRIFDPFSC